MTVKLGINPITWTNDDDPSLGGDIPLEVCLEETREAGFVGTELGGKFPREPQSLRKILDQYGLQLVSGWYDGRILERDVDAEFESVTPHLTLLKELGSPVVVYADTSRGRTNAIWEPISRRPKLADEEWRPYGRKVTELAERMAEFGVRMAFHHHMGTVVETDEEVDRLMSVTGEAVGLLFDSGHCMFAGGEPASLLERHVGRVVHVHCKDVRRDALEQARRQDLSFMQAVLDGVFTVPGDGDIDFDVLLRTLHLAEYSGWLVVEAEQDPKKAHPLTYARIGHDALSAAARAAGFTLEARS